MCREKAFEKETWRTKFAREERYKLLWKEGCPGVGHMGEGDFTAADRRIKACVKEGYYWEDNKVIPLERNRVHEKRGIESE